jgi:hypothetical protein
MSIIIKGGASINLAEVTSNNELKVFSEPVRTTINIYGSALAVGATTVEAALTLSKSAGTAAASSAASFVVTAGKRFRITSIVLAQVGSATATLATSIFRLRVNPTGAVTTATTPVIWQSPRILTPATASAYQQFSLPIPFGMDIFGDGTLQFGFTVNSTFVTNAPTVDIAVSGYEF